MKKTFLFAMGALLGGALLFTSCGKDDKEDDPQPEPEVDIRDAAVGNFNGTMTWYWLVDGEFEADEETFGEPESVNISVSKDGTNSNAIRLDVDGDVFYGSKIEAASNGFGFDIETQTFDGMTIKGYDAGSVGTTKYNGVYLDDTKKLNVGFQVSIKDIIKDFTADIEDEDEKEDMELLLNAACAAVGAEGAVVIFDMNKR